MTHKLGRVVPDGRSLNETTGLDFVPPPGALGGPRFVILHFDNVALSAPATLTVPLGYGTDIFHADAGSDFWTRPIDTSIGTIQIRIAGGTGSARLKEFGSGEPSIPTGQTPGTSTGSLSDPDVFLQTNPYQEPIYETRLECDPGFAWRNAACALSIVPTAVKDRVKAATGIIVEVDLGPGSVSSCSGTLIGADLFLTARHCLTDPAGEDVGSSSVTFDYATNCDGTRPPGHVTRFFKVLGEVVSGSPPTGVDPPTATDWVVLRLDAAPGALPAPLTMRDTALMTNETIFTMHHPNGAVKKTQEGTFHGGSSITGFDYAGGSSGSALFDINGNLVGGPLSGGGGCSVVYAPVGAVKAALATPPPPPTPLDVTIVFDRSGSMGSAAPPAGRTKLQEAQDAASLFVRLVREGAGDELGLVTFSSVASLPVSPGPAATTKPILTGPAPFTSGQIGGITAGGATSIGAGLGAALLSFPGGPNQRAILLMTDGLQNTPPMVEDVEGSLGSTKLSVVGFGSDADIDAPLLSRLARQHGGQFTRALDGLALRKFFGLSFGNIFETGALTDPDRVLLAAQQTSEVHRFDVCGEEQITLVVGWDHPNTPLQAQIRTPSGRLLDKRIRPVVGNTWAFWRIPLPYRGERDGTWQFTVERIPTGGEFPPPPTDVRYFYLVVCSGGPKLMPLAGPRRVYTGDPIDPLVGLHYGNRTAPPATVELTVEAPSLALGRLVQDAGLRPPSTTGDAVGAFHATLQSIQREAGGELPVGRRAVRVPLFDDGVHDDGGLEADGIYNNRLKDLTLVEGTYHFHAVATYGDGCTATREAFWAIHVEPGIDPDRTGVTVVITGDQPDGRHGTLIITPNDTYGNPLGPGRGDRFTVSPLSGVRISGGVKDQGDGSYGVDIVWDPSVTPGVLVNQPDREPVTIAPPVPARDCTKAADNLLDCLGIPAGEVKSVRVKRVWLDVKMKDDDCC
jgi:hypothetical protein